ncbi:hypothetical protein SynA1544_01236 [Synechococcus sp. A15-44]|nr:hypothetical protein SynA1544_01236 [Synechococcus sp. A15-44]
MLLKERLIGWMDAHVGTLWDFFGLRKSLNSPQEPSSSPSAT